MPLDRRALLQALGAFAVTTLAGAAGAAPVSGSALKPGQFSQLSAALTANPIADPALSAKIFTAFATPARRAALAQLAEIVASHPGADMDAAIHGKGLDKLANELVAAWYSGIVDTPGGKKVVAYTDAQLWSALSFTKPMGVCGGETGYWAKPPQG